EEGHAGEDRDGPPGRIRVAPQDPDRLRRGVRVRARARDLDRPDPGSEGSDEGQAGACGDERGGDPAGERAVVGAGLGRGPFSLGPRDVLHHEGPRPSQRFPARIAWLAGSVVPDRLVLQTLYGFGAFGPIPPPLLLPPWSV